MNTNRQISGRSIGLRWNITAASLAMTAAAMFGGSAQASDKVTLVCEMRGNQEAPIPVVTPARGCGTFVIDRNANTITFRIAFSGLTTPETAAHFHGNSPPGVASPVKIALPVGNPKVGTVVYAEADEAAILGGQWYVNIHTVANPGGEIRGQIGHFAASLNSFQEGPAVVATAGQGWATFRLNTCANTLTYHIVIEPGTLSSAEVAAHIHGFSAHTVNSGIVHALPLGSPKVGVWNYNESDEPAILNGMTYVNIHTVNFGAGEIRGQIVNTVVPMDQLQEPPCGATAPRHGCLYCSFNRPINTLGYYLEYNGLSGPETASHFHGYTAPCVAGPVQLATAAGLQKKGLWAYLAVNAANVAAGLSYHNVHTAALPAGEIRGQIIPALGRCVFDVNCNGTADIDDLLTVINSWGPCPANPVPCPADTNYTGTIDIDDLLNVINGWGKCP